jgi:predicted NAD-dependent protein-ADP-ribosyltransferase YbiA (DUF1768 family)
MKKIIIIDKDDEKYGYLSNQSPYGFTVDNIRWRSVEEYYIAKKYGISTSEIKKADTHYKLQMLSTARKTLDINDSYTISFGIKYPGVNDTPESIPDVEILTEGITYKFLQNKILSNRLISTKSAIIRDPMSKDTGRILMDLRDKFLDKNKHSIIVNLTDLKDTTYVYEHVAEIYHLLYDISEKYANAEGWDIILPEMVTDAIRTLTPSYFKVNTNIIRITKDPKLWVHIHKKMIRFDKINDQFFDEICEKNPRYEEDVMVSLFISLFIYFLFSNLLFSETEKEKIFQKITKFQTEGISDEYIKISPESRWYRKQVPPMFETKEDDQTKMI